MKLQGKNIVVTGGSRGIGAGIAVRLAREGACVAITYTSRPGAAEKFLSELGNNTQHMLVKMDVSQDESVEQGFSEIFKAFGKIDGLVNNAGVTRDQLLLRMKTDDFDTV